ncbi:MAG: hypothetical protein IKK17_07860, partial [Oscillospiraceae bacterium]|nr:hypothetical protein [Oscillospiraceae bacterium]
ADRLGLVIVAVDQFAAANGANLFIRELNNLRNFEECWKNNEDIFENPLEKPQCFCYAKISGIYAAIFSFFEKSIPRKGMSLL